MIVTKSKNYNVLPLWELKDHVNVHDTEQYDSLLTRLLKVAVAIAEDFIGDDIVPTVSTLQEQSYRTNFCYLDYPVLTSRITVTGVTVGVGYGSDVVTSTISPSDYAVEKYSNYTNINFRNSISGNVLQIGYTSGYSTVPEPIRQAIYIKVKELFDVDRSGYIPAQSAVVTTKAFERILSPYINSIY